MVALWIVHPDLRATLMYVNPRTLMYANPTLMYATLMNMNATLKYVLM